jgi:Zn-dependent peptidase ImmA (M78 family)
MFTIVHELAHIWTGNSAGFDFRQMQPANDPVEELCDKVAAEFLVPENHFLNLWDKNKKLLICFAHVLCFSLFTKSLRGAGPVITDC